MSARTMWKGVLHVGKHEVPVRLFAAARDHSVHFRLLHRKDREPVRQRMIDPKSGEEVPSDERVRGAELEPGRFVILDDEDLAALEPEASREIELERFVPREALHLEWYERPYLLGPEGDPEAYRALARALAEQDLEGIARWVMRKKEYVGALVPHEGRLALVTLRFAEQVVDPASIETPEVEELDEDEVRMAEQLVGMLEADFDPNAYRDEYRERVLDMIDKKARGKKVDTPKARPKRQRSLSNALKASLAEAKKGRDDDSAAKARKGSKKGRGKRGRSGKARKGA